MSCSFKNGLCEFRSINPWRPELFICFYAVEKKITGSSSKMTWRTSRSHPTPSCSSLKSKGHMLRRSWDIRGLRKWTKPWEGKYVWKNLWRFSSHNLWNGSMLLLLPMQTGPCSISQSCMVLFCGCVCITHDMCAVALPTVEVAYSAGESQILPTGQDKGAPSQTAVPWMEQQ